MTYVCMSVTAIGIILLLVGAIMFLVAAFRQSILWGLGSIFVPFVALFFLFMHWDVAKRPFLIKMLGLVITILGVVLTTVTTHKALA